MTIANTEKELRAIFDELMDQTDRGAAIIGAAILDDLLADALQKRLILKKSLSAKLFDDGPLSTFSAKIDIALATGIISHNIWSNLNLIRRIRNRFAHKVEPIKFTDAEIAAWCSTLDATLSDFIISRNRFMSAINMISSILIVYQSLDIKLVRYTSTPEGLKEANAAIEALLPEEIEASQ